MRIAVDAMGGDHAPLVNVDGAIAAAREFGIHTLLVGKAYWLNDMREFSNTLAFAVIAMYGPQEPPCARAEADGLCTGDPDVASRAPTSARSAEPAPSASAAMRTGGCAPSCQMRQTKAS